MKMTSSHLKSEEFNNVCDKVLLEETFYVLRKKNSVFKVKLTNSGLNLVKETDSHIKETLIPIQDVIGCRCLRSKKQTNSCACQALPRSSSSVKVVDDNSEERDDNDISAYLYIYAYILQCNKGLPVRRVRTIITLRFRSFDKYEDNNKEAQKWRCVIKQLIRGEMHNSASIQDFSLISAPKESRKLLVLCNPKSGPGKGKAIFQEKIVPVLKEAEIPYDLHITKHANYARQFVRTNNIFQWSAIVTVGGDGIVYEVLNGLFERPDWQEALHSLPIGVIAGGSGNGLARSIAHSAGEPYPTGGAGSALPAALALVRGGRGAAMDLVRVETRSQTMFSFLSVGWGFLADVDIESERLRIFGGQRFTVWSVARLIGLKMYEGKVWYIPAVAVEADRRGGAADTTNTEGGEGATTPQKTLSSRPRLDSWYSATSRRSTYFSTTNSSYQSTNQHDDDDADDDCDLSPSSSSSNVRMYGPPSRLPCLTSPLSSSSSTDGGTTGDNWQCLEGPFIMVYASYLSHLSEECLFVPAARLDDGLIWLVVVRADITRPQMLQFLLGLSDGSHLTSSSPSVQLLPVSAFRIEPAASQSGYITVDGEHVEYGPIQAEIFPGLGRVMVP